MKYAIACDGELIASGLELRQVLEVLKLKAHGKLEIASYHLELRKWIPVNSNEFEARA